jgi:2-keto-3-deoxy-6-phosphogluconate aldolase
MTERAGRSPRRVMPGRPLPEIATQDVEHAAFSLIRNLDGFVTRRLTFTISDDNQPQSGARGLTFNKLDKTDPYAHGIAFAVEGDYKWGLGMDFDTNNELGNADFVPVFDHSANDGAGADVFRCSMAEDSTFGPLATKFAIGERGGGPRANTEGLLVACGDTATSLGGVRINYWSSGTSRFALVLINAHGTNNNCLVNFNDQFYLGTDITGAGTQSFHLWDQVAAALRLTVDSSGRFKIGTGSPTAYLHLPAGSTTVAPLKLTSGTNLTSAEAGSFEYDGAELYFSPSTTRLKVLRDTFTEATNITLGTVTGSKIGTATTQKLGFFNATPIVQPANTADLRQSLIDLGLYASGGATPLSLNGGNLTAAALLTSTGISGSGVPLIFPRNTTTPGADADVTVSTPNSDKPVQQVNTGSWASGHNVILPTTTDAIYVVFNNTTFTATFKTSGGTGVAVATGLSAWIRCDGTNYVRVTADA